MAQTPTEAITRILKRDTKTLPLPGGKQLRMPRLPRWITPDIGIVSATLIIIGLVFPYLSSVPTFDLPKAGDVAKETIIAPFTFDILKSHEQLEKERSQAMDRIPLVVDYNKSTQKTVRENFRRLRAGFVQLGDQKTSDSIKVPLRTDLKRGLSDNTIGKILQNRDILEYALSQAESILKKGVLAVLLVESTQKLNDFRAQYNTSFDRHLVYAGEYVTMRKDSVETTVRYSDVPVKEIALENAIKQLKSSRGLDSEELNAVYELLFAYVTPNVTLNGEETALRKQKASQEILTIKGKVIKDTEIVRKHQEVTIEIVEKLRSLRTAMTSLDSAGLNRRLFVTNTGRFLMAVVPFLFLLFYLYAFHRKMVYNTPHFLAFAVIIVLQVLVIRFGIMLVPRLFEGNPELTMIVPEYLIPATIASMLVTILYGAELGFVLSLYFAIFFGVVMGFNHSLFLFVLLGGLVAGFTAKNIRYRWDFFKAIPPIVLVYGVLVVLWHVTTYKLSFLSIVQNIGLSMINAIMATFLSMTATTFLETFFRLTSNMTLVELSDMNHPVLKKLSIEAAGTYNHSVLTANLAESAAAKIGANALLARVASYYHDIGKLTKTGYFVENTTSADRNRHNRLSPSMSALIISSHVKEGVELAKKNKLPQAIQDAILQHHGDSTVSFFYEKALEQDPHKQVQEKDFRYPGPRPQTRENAIIMLADSVEAAARSLATSSPKLLRELVKKIIRDKFMSSQLDQCDLTLKDLDDIVEGFMPILQGIFHSRIEYPNK